MRRLLADRTHWARLPDQVSDWLRIQSEVSVLPGPDEILVETFPRGQRHYLVCYPFEGRLAHQSLGMLLTRRLERGYAKPLGFVANEYALCVWGLADMGAMVTSGRLDLARLFDEDMLGEDLDAWLEIGRESVPGDASEALLREAVEELIAEAMGDHAALDV